MHQHGSIFLPIDPSPDPEMGSKGQNSTASEQGHVAYQIKGNAECSNIQAHILSLHAPRPLGSN